MGAVWLGLLLAYLLFLCGALFFRKKIPASLRSRIGVRLILILLLPIGLLPLVYISLEKPPGYFGGLPPEEPPGELRQRIDRHISRLAARHGLDPLLVRAVVEAESSYDPRALSPKGAKGLMQLIPPTAESLGVLDPFDMEENIDAGVRYLKHMLKRYRGSLRLALAAYNAGPEAVKKYGGVPPFPETRSYVRRVLSRYRQLKEREREDAGAGIPEGRGPGTSQKAGRKGAA